MQKSVKMRTIKQEHYFPLIIAIHFILWAIDLFFYQGGTKEVHSDTLFFGEMKGDLWSNTHRIMGEVFSSWAVTVFAANFLMATRAKWVEKIFGGLDKMYMIHRRSGVIAVVLLLLHFLFVPRDLTEFTVGKPLGFYALVLILVGVVLSVAPVFKQKIKYHKWIKFHKLMGVFYIMGIVHSLKVPTLTSELPLVRTYVYGMAILGILAWIYKAFLYNIFNKKLDYSVNSIKHFENDTTEIQLVPINKKLAYEAGQFTFVSFDGLNKNESHPFTISNHPSEDHLRLTIRSLGDYTADLQSSLKEDAKAKIQGAFGQFNYIKAKNKDQIWLAGGIGITPFLSFLKELNLNFKVTLIWSVKTVDQANYKDEIEKAVSQNSNLNFVLWDSGTKGYFSIGKKFKSNTLKNKSVFICGPEIMRESYIKQLMEKGVSINDMHYEEFSFR